MIQITPQMRILVAVEAIDGRKGIDALAQLCREKLKEDPFSGCLIVFRTRNAAAIKSWPMTYVESSVMCSHSPTAARVLCRRGPDCTFGLETFQPLQERSGWYAKIVWYTRSSSLSRRLDCSGNSPRTL